MIRSYIILALWAMAFASCSDTIDFAIVSNSKIDLVSEISVDDPVVVIAQQTGGLQDGTGVVFPEMEINLIVDGLPKSIRRQESLGDGFYTNNQIQLEVGKEYEIQASIIGDDDTPTVLARTFIPAPGNIVEESFEFNSQAYTLESSLTDDTERRVVDISFTVAKSTEDNSYFHLEAFRLDENEDLIALEIADQNLGNNPYDLMVHRNGILFNLIDVDIESLGFTFASIEFLDPAFSDLDKIQLRLKTVTRNYYNYHKKLSAQINASVSPINEPIINFTNIENGFGVFAGYSKSEHLFEY